MSKQFLTQLDLQTLANLTVPGTNFIGFAAKADGLYQKIGNNTDLRLLTTSDGAGYATLSHTHSNYEVITNKVTSISGSSTDIQYPSAKLLYDQLALKQAAGSYVTGTPWTAMGYVTGTPWTGMGYEVTTNKVTSISGSSTDIQYPSAKLLYDQLALKQAAGSYVTGTPWTIMGYVTGTPWTAMGYVTGTPWTGMGYEVTSNKVTSISGSSTDTQYPSAKLLYDQLALKQVAGSYVTGTPWTGMGYVTGTPWTGMGYLTSQTSHADVLVDSDFASQGIMLRGASSGAYSILTDNSTNWNTAFGWGNHSGLYSLTGHTHSGYQATLSGTGFVKSTAGVISYDTNTYVTGTPWTGMGYVTGTPWTAMGYLTSQTSHADVLVDSDFASQGIMLRGASSGAYSILTDSSSNWNTAYTKSHFYLTLSSLTGLSLDVSNQILSMTSGYLIPTTASQSNWDSAYASIGKVSNGTYSGILNTTDFSFSYGVFGVAGKEASLGNPGTNGYVLSSTTSGVRSWIAMGGSYTLPLAANGTRGGIQITGGTPAAGCLPVSLYNESPYVSMTKAVVEYVLTGSISTHTHSYEAPLGNPGTTGYVLSSTSAGVRSWVAMGGSYTLPVATTGALGGVSLNFSATGAAVPLQISGNNAFVTVSKAAIETSLTGLISTHTHSYALVNGSSSNAFATANLSVTGTIVASSTITGSEIWRTSSRALKTNISNFNFNALRFLNEVEIMQYNLKTNGAFAIGFIAEDTHPWLSGMEQKSHNFGNHLGLLTKAIQEEDEKVNKMKIEILDLKRQINDLKAKQYGR